MINSKKIYSITLVLLFLVFFILTLFTYLLKTSANIDGQITYHDHLVDMQLINKSFDNFLLKKSTFINYDDINLKITNFDKTIEKINAINDVDLFIHLGNLTKNSYQE